MKPNKMKLIQGELRHLSIVHGINHYNRQALRALISRYTTVETRRRQASTPEIWYNKDRYITKLCQQGNLIRQGKIYYYRSKPETQ